MKSAKKILALILAGVMALALLTGCGKAASLDRTIAEGIAEYHKSGNSLNWGEITIISPSAIRFPSSAVISPPCLMKTGSPKVAMVISLTATTWSTVRPSKLP